VYLTSDHDRTGKTARVSNPVERLPEETF
jgi:hypothetical protein